MSLSRVSIFIWTFMVFTAAQPLCDPSTQYELNGECCKKCGPGYSMSGNACQNPVCKDCGENEYMDTYTTEARCESQPYCDPNKHFQLSKHASKKKRTTCLCKEGFHCSSETCITCVGHTECKAGYGAKIKGNQTHDTVCEKCPDGTFSDKVSWDGVCQKKTECSSEYDSQDVGDNSDSLCVKKPRSHIGLICAVVGLVFAVVVVLLFLCFFCKDKTKYAKQKVKTCLEAQNDTELHEEKLFPITPTDDSPGSLMTTQISQEECQTTLPEENEDTAFTVNGNILTQEGGKETILSQPETNETIVSF